MRNFCPVTGKEDYREYQTNIGGVLYHEGHSDSGCYHCITADGEVGLHNGFSTTIARTFHDLKEGLTVHSYPEAHAQLVDNMLGKASLFLAINAPEKLLVRKAAVTVDGNSSGAIAMDAINVGGNAPATPIPAPSAAPIQPSSTTETEVTN